MSIFIESDRVKSIVLTMVSVAIIAAFVIYLYLNSDQYTRLLELSLGRVMLIMALALVQQVLNGAINVHMFRSLGANLSHTEGFHIVAASTLANQLPISGGLVIRGMYLKHKFALSYAKYFSAMFAFFFCTLAVYGLLGGLILLYWFLFKGVVVAPVLYIGFVLMSSSLLIFLVPIGSMKGPEVMLKWIRQSLDGWMVISKNVRLLSRLLGLQTIIMLLLAFRYWLAFHMLSQSVTIEQAVLFSCASILTQVISFAPGGLGVREAIVGGMASALGFDISVSIVAVGLDRLVTFIPIVITGWISTIVLGKDLSVVSAK
jgi:uncharacterized membrane protein YbhN (UPF0104 family)